MSNNRSRGDREIVAAFALIGSAVLVLAYFQIPSALLNKDWKDFLQAVLGNVFATTLSFFFLYMFITWTKVSLGDDRNSSELLDEITTVRDAVTFKNSTGEIDKRLNKNWLWEAYSNCLNGDIKKINSELIKHFEILEAIRDESKDSDKIQERIKINSELAFLRERLQSVNQVSITKDQELVKRGQELNKKDQELARKDREREDLITQIASLTYQMRSIETSFSKALTDMGNKLKESQEKDMAKLKNNVGSKLRETQDSLSSDIKSSISSLLSSSKTVHGSTQLLLPDRAKVNSVSNTLTSKIGDQAENIDRDLDAVTNNMRSNLIEFLDEAIRKAREGFPTREY